MGIISCFTPFLYMFRKCCTTAWTRFYGSSLLYYYAGVIFFTILRYVGGPGYIELIKIFCSKTSSVQIIREFTLKLELQLQALFVLSESSYCSCSYSCSCKLCSYYQRVLIVVVVRVVVASSVRIIREFLLQLQLEISWKWTSSSIIGHLIRSINKL